MELKTEKKRVLVFIDWFLPGDKAGGPVRSCANLIDHLSDSFEFSVVTRDTDYTEENPMQGIKSNAWNILPDGKRVYYISKNELNKKTIERILTEEKYGAVYLNGIWSQPFTAWPLQILKKQKSKIRKVVAARGMLAPSALAIKATKKKLFLLLAKWRKYFGDVIFHATTEKEANEIRNAFGKSAEILVVGNLPRKIIQKPLRGKKNKNELKIISVARISPEKNTLYALEVLSKLKCKVTADFFGTVYDENYFKQCESTAKIAPSNASINFKGALPSELIFEKVAAYDLMFMPTRGENFGHIILESLQAGTPVLISDQTPWKNLEEKNAGWDFALTDQNKFIEQIEMLATMNEEEFSKWERGAQKLGEEYSSAKEVLNANKILFQE